MKHLFIKQKKNISTLITCDKLPVRTIQEQHELEFLANLPLYSYLDDLRHLGNIAQKMQKTVKNMKKQKHLYKKNKDRMVNCQIPCLNQLGY